MKKLASVFLFTVVVALPAFAGTLPLITKCPPDAVLVGQTCVDKYEASVWRIPATNAGKSNAGLINKAKNGKAVEGDLIAAGATLLSPSSICFDPSITSCCSGILLANFPGNGQWTPEAGFTPPSPGVFAVSIPGVLPTACITWFQAEQACAASGKRLLTNQEWQRAAAGTPEGAAGDNGTTQCNTSQISHAVDTGSRSACVSNYGAFDMVGNVDEWVADWVPASNNCGSWGGSADDQCLAGAAISGEPGALIRGGAFFPYVNSGAGPFAVSGIQTPSVDGRSSTGFRCGR